MFRYAQTNVQLYNQMRRAGYGDGDVRLARIAYEYGMMLFTGRYHPSGKPLLAHVVGTASILAAERLPAPVVAAGLLHAAYRHGDFGRGEPGPSSENRGELRREMGDEIESLVYEYLRVPWGPNGIPAWSEQVASASPVQRFACLLRIADALENYVDLAAGYCGESRLGPYLRGDGFELICSLATDLGHPSLAAAWRECLSEFDSARIPDGLRREGDEHFAIAPRSTKPELAARIRGLVERDR